VVGGVSGAVDRRTGDSRSAAPAPGRPAARCQPKTNRRAGGAQARHGPVDTPCLFGLAPLTDRTLCLHECVHPLTEESLKTAAAILLDGPPQRKGL